MGIGGPFLLQNANSSESIITFISLKLLFLSMKESVLPHPLPRNWKFIHWWNLLLWWKESGKRERERRLLDNDYDPWIICCRDSCIKINFAVVLFTLTVCMTKLWINCLIKKTESEQARFLFAEIFLITFAEWHGRAVKFNFIAVSFQLVQFNCFCKIAFFSLWCRSVEKSCWRYNVNLILHREKSLMWYESCMQTSGMLTHFHIDTKFTKKKGKLMIFKQSASKFLAR